MDSTWKTVLEVSLFENKAEWQQIIELLSDEPIDAISVSTYGYSEKAFGTDQNMAQLTRAVTDLPIMICGKIYDRASADDALRDANIVLSAKSILLNPNWVEDIRAGKELPLFESKEANVAYTDTPLPWRIAWILHANNPHRSLRSNLIACLEKDSRNLLYSYDRDFDKFSVIKSGCYSQSSGIKPISASVYFITHDLKNGLSNS